MFLTGLVIGAAIGAAIIVAWSIRAEIERVES